MKAAAAITGDPRRLAVLAELWRSAGSEVWVTLQGGSMSPAIPPGSRVRLSCRRQAIRPGQIVAYRRNDALVVHRVVAVVTADADGSRTIVCQGDSNQNADAPVALDAVLGVVTASRRAPCPRHLAARLRKAAARCRRALGRFAGRQSPSISNGGRLG